MPSYQVRVDLSRIHRLSLLYAVDASNPTEANATARARAREAMDGRRPDLDDPATERFLPWALDHSELDTP